RPARSLRRTISLLSTFGAVAGVQLQTSRSIKPRERDLGDLRLFFLARFLTRPTNHPRHAACASNFKSKPVRPRRDINIADRPNLAKKGGTPVASGGGEKQRLSRTLDRHRTATRLIPLCDGTSAAAPASFQVATLSSFPSRRAGGPGSAHSLTPIFPTNWAGNFLSISPTVATLGFRALVTRTTVSRIEPKALPGTDAAG